MSTVAETVAERVTGNRPSRFKSILVSATVGFTAAALAYRLLRSGADGSEETADENA